MNRKNFAILLLLTGTILIMKPVAAQVTFERSYDHSLSATKIDATEYKYFLMDVAQSQCRVYHTDHTLWKTIPITLPANYYLYDIKFVTRNLFNQDDALELWYSAYEYTTAETGRYTAGIVSENGTVLATMPGGLYGYVIRTGETAYKLAVYAYDYTVSPGKVQTLLYALPSSATAAAHVTTLLSDPWPNPASGEIMLPLPPGEKGILLRVTSSTGQVMLEKRSTGEPFFRLNTSGWAPGTYSYRLLSGQTSSVSKRFIVQ